MEKQNSSTLKLEIYLPAHLAVYCILLLEECSAKNCPKNFYVFRFLSENIRHCQLIVYAVQHMLESLSVSTEIN